MKKKLPFIIEIIIGIIFICFGYFVIDTDYYSTLFYAIGLLLVGFPAENIRTTGKTQ